MQFVNGKSIVTLHITLLITSKKKRGGTNKCFLNLFIAFFLENPLKMPYVILDILSLAIQK